MSYHDPRIGRDAAADIPGSIGRSDPFEDSLIHQPRGGRARQGWTPVRSEVRDLKETTAQSQRQSFFQSFHRQQARALSHTVAVDWDQRESRKKGMLQRRKKDFDRQQRPHRRRRLPAARTLRHGEGSAGRSRPPAPMAGMLVIGAGPTGAATDEPGTAVGSDPATPGRSAQPQAPTAPMRRGASAEAISTVEGGALGQGATPRAGAAAGLATPPPSAPARIGTRLSRSVQRAPAFSGGLSRYQGQDAGFPVPSSDYALSSGEGVDGPRAKATEGEAVRACRPAAAPALVRPFLRCVRSLPPFPLAAGARRRRGSSQRHRTRGGDPGLRVPGPVRGPGAGAAPRAQPPLPPHRGATVCAAAASILCQPLHACPARLH